MFHPERPLGGVVRARGAAHGMRGIVAALGRLLALQPSAMPVSKPRHAVIHVDPCVEAHDTDMRVQLTADECEARGVLYVPVWSESLLYSLRALGTTDEEEAEYRARLAPEASEAAAWCETALPAGCEVIGVCCGSDAGLGCAERLQHALVPERSNGLLNARRDKFEQHEALRACGLDAARQAVASEWEVAVRVRARARARVRVGIGASSPTHSSRRRRRAS